MADEGDEIEPTEAAVVDEIVARRETAEVDEIVAAEEAVAAESSSRAPSWLIWTIIVVATLVAMGAVLNTWVNRQVLETDEWVEVADNLLDDDDVRGALSTYLVAELFRTADVQGGLAEVLPEELEALSGPLAATLESNAGPVADRLLATSAARSAWSELNETAHQLFVSIVQDDLRDGLTTADGQLAIELDELVVLVGERIGLSEDVLERISDEAGTLVVFESTELDLAQQAVSVIQFLSVFLLIAVFALYALAVWLSGDRRRAIRNVGWAIVVASAILLLVRRVSVRIATEQLAQADSAREAIESIVTITTNLLNELAWAGAAIGVLMVSYALLVGPTVAAARVRRWLQPVLTNTISIYAAGFLGMLLLFAFVPGFTLRTWAAALIFGGLALAGIEMTRRFCVAERSARSVAEQSVQSAGDELEGERSSKYTSIG